LLNLKRNLANLTAKTSKLRLGSAWRVRTFGAGALLLVALILISVASVSRAQNFEDERRALARAKAQSMLAEQRAERLESIAADQMSGAEAARSRAAAVASRIQAAEADISAAESRIALIERMRAEQRAQLAAKQEPAVRLMAALQTLARRPPALALVQPGSVSDLVHVRAVLAGLVPRLRARTADLRAEIDRGRALRADAGRALAALEVSQQRLATQRSQLLTLSAARRTEAERTTGSALIEQDKAMALGEKARDIVDLMDRLSVDGEVRERLFDLPGPTLRPAKPGDSTDLPATAAPATGAGLPYRLPVSGTVIAGLGEVSSDGVRSRGLTLATRPGAQIVAPSGGTVTFAGKYGGYGTIVIIDHGRGWTSLITSINGLDVRVGDSVIQGSPIGRAGNDNPTVTVELRQKNQPVDITQLIG
jgi:murein hydrolase activator